MCVCYLICHCIRMTVVDRVIRFCCHRHIYSILLNTYCMPGQQFNGLCVTLYWKCILCDIWIMNSHWECNKFASSIKVAPWTKQQKYKSSLPILITALLLYWWWFITAMHSIRTNEDRISIVEIACNLIVVGGLEGWSQHSIVSDQSHIIESVRLK